MSRLKYRLAFHPDERARLIELRTIIYRGVGKHAADEPMRDAFDDGALLVGVYLDDKPVACARVICRPADAEWEHDRFVQWSDRLPAREQCAEISRFCILRQHRNWTTLRMLCLGVAQAMLLTRQKYFIACCTDDLVSFYRDFLCGQFVGIRFRHSDLGGKAHELFVVPFHSGMLREGVNLLDWVCVWPRVAVAGLRTGLIGQEWSALRRAAWFVALCAGALVSPFSVFFAQDLRRSRRKTRDTVHVSPGPQVAS